MTDVILRAPTIADGPALWQLATDSAALDVNSPYAYLLWCRDFAATSVIAEIARRPAGFVTGYRRPDRSDTLMIWQVAVDATHRGAGIAGRMVDRLVRDGLSHGLTHLETSITPDNTASRRLFEGLARRWDAVLERTELFSAELFGDAHLAEELFRIGPLRVSDSG